jgi:hypothetical protein
MRKYCLLLVVFSLALVLSACQKAGSEYLGKWQDAAHPNSGTIEITRNGDTYLVMITMPGAFGGKPQSKTIPAVVKDGLLQIGSGFGSMTLTYVKGTDGLLASGGLGATGEMKRIK